MERLLKVVSARDIEAFVADREFVGQAWFAYLNSEHIAFHIRIRRDTLCDRWLRVSVFFAKRPVGEARTLHQRYRLMGQALAVSGMRLEDDYLIVVSNRNPKEALARYALRWEVEMLFAALKTTGFDFQTSHLKDLGRIDKLLSLTAIAFCFAHLVGEWLHKTSRKPLKLKGHGRRAKTLFRHGLDHLAFILNHIHNRYTDFISCLRVLSCT
jgi:hypothetical protein